MKSETKLLQDRMPPRKRHLPEPDEVGICVARVRGKECGAEFFDHPHDHREHYEPKYKGCCSGCGRKEGDTIHAGW